MTATTAEADDVSGWGSDTDWNSGSLTSQSKQTSTSQKQQKSTWNDQDFTADTTSNPASSYNWDQPNPDSDEFFTSLIADKKSLIKTFSDLIPIACRQQYY